MRKLTKKTVTTSQATLYAVETRTPIKITPWEQSQINQANAAKTGTAYCDMYTENYDGDNEFVLSDCLASREDEISGWMQNFRYSKAYYEGAPVYFYSKSGALIGTRYAVNML